MAQGSRKPQGPTPDLRDPRHVLAIDDTLDLVPAANVSANKLASYAQGPARKSRHEKEKEAAAAKQRQEEEEAAKAYDDFVAAFGVEDDGGRGTVRSKGKGFVRAGGGEGYNPLKDREKEMVGIPTGPKASYSRVTAARLMEDDEPSSSSFKPSGPPGKKKRDMDNFLEELKRDQKEREDRLRHQAGRVGSSVTALAAREHAPVLTGSFDSGDPLTTNIHVAGLPQNVTEQSLGLFFARYGPVGSVKIMWPRADAAPALGPGGRRQLGGFVAFLRRPDAEKAAKELDGAEWGGTLLRTGWGKAVPLPARAIYEIEGASSRSDRDRDRDHRGSRRRRSSSYERSRSPDRSSRSKRRRSYASDAGSRSRSPLRRQWPMLEEGVDDKFLRTVADKVRNHGRSFEDMMREREKNNPRFAFFVNKKLPSYHYFKMLLDPDYRPSMTTFSDEGNADIYSSDSAEDSERERVPKGKLGKFAQKRFESLLRSLTSTREKIARGMVFALEHADAASLIVDLLVASLTLEATPVPRKIARLHLVSDILHNASASLPNAWVYRSIFEARLPVVFDHLGDIYLSFPGRMKAEQFRMQVINIVDVWERDWIIFEPGVIEDFKQRLSGTTVATESTHEDDAPLDSTSMPSTTAPTLGAESDVAAPSPRPGFKNTGFKTTFLPSALTAALPDEVVGGDEEGDLDGEDVDGAPMMIGEEEDVDGNEVDLDDVDGEEMAVVAAPTEVLVLEDDDAMDMGSDDDMF